MALPHVWGEAGVVAQGDVADGVAVGRLVADLPARARGRRPRGS